MMITKIKDWFKRNKLELIIIHFYWPILLLFLVICIGIFNYKAAWPVIEAINKTIGTGLLTMLMTAIGLISFTTNMILVKEIKKLKKAKK